jgi:hypothetical protein
LWEFSDAPGWFIVNLYSTTTFPLSLAAVFDFLDLRHYNGEKIVVSKQINCMYSGKAGD